MHQASQANQFDYHYYPAFEEDQIICDWEALRWQLLLQWPLLSADEVDDAGPHRCLLAELVERKYGIDSRLAENYLRNFERTMPL